MSDRAIEFEAIVVSDDDNEEFDEIVDSETEAFVEAYLRPPAEYRAYIAERLASFTEVRLDRAV